MKMRIRKTFQKLLVIAALVLGSAVAVPALSPRTVSAHHCVGHAGSQTAEIATCLDAGACLNTDGSVNCPAQSSAEGSLNRVVGTAINVLSVAVGIVAVIMIIIAGFKYITAGGESANISSAKSTITYAIIGLVIVALAQIIVRFVLSRVT